MRFGDQERRRIGDAISGDNLRKMLDIVHRNTVEDIKEISNERSNTESAISSVPPVKAIECKKLEGIEYVEESEEGISEVDISDSGEKNTVNSAIESIGDSSSEKQNSKSILEKPISTDGSGDKR